MQTRVFLLSPANCNGIRAKQAMSPQGAVRAGGGAALGGRRAARRSFQLRQRPLLPRQADLRAPLRAAARSAESDRRQRHPRDHAERGAAQPGHAHHPAAVRAFARGDVDADNARYRRPLEASARALLAEIGPDCDVVLLGSVASPKYVDRARHDLRRAAEVPGRVRRPRRHVARRAAAASRARRRRARLRPGARRGPPRRPAAEAAADPMADARLKASKQKPGPRRRRSKAQPFDTAEGPRAQGWPADDPARPGQRHPGGRRQGSPPHQPPQDLLAGARAHQGRPAPVLRRRRRRAAAARARSRDGDEALPARRLRRVLLHEARADAAAGVDRDLPDRSRQRERHRLSDDSGPRGAAVGDQPRVHRPEPVVRDLRRRRSARLPAFRSRPRRRRRLRPRASRRRWSSTKRSTR